MKRKFLFFSEACNYLLIYEYVPDFDSDAWGAFKRGLATKSITKDDTEDEEEDEEIKKKPKKSHNKTLLLGGRKDGYICVYDWMTGKVTFKVDVRLYLMVYKKQSLLNTRTFIVNQIGFKGNRFLSYVISTGGAVMVVIVW